MKYMVIVKINGKSFLTNVDAETAGGAEHKIERLGFVYKTNKVFDKIQAFSLDEIGTEYFGYLAALSQLVSFEELARRINAANKINMNQKEIDELDVLIESLKEQREALAKECFTYTEQIEGR